MKDMQTTPHARLGLLDRLMTAPPANEFLERLDPTLDWRPLERALPAIYSAAMRANRLFSSLRCKLEKVFGW